MIKILILIFSILITLSCTEPIDTTTKECESNIDCKDNPIKRVCDLRPNSPTINSCIQELLICDPSCKEWENCNNGNCETKVDRCNENSDCDTSYICDSSHNCIKTTLNCDPICEEWENCNNGSCKLANNRCYTTNDCNDNYICGASNNCIEDPSICNPICKEWENCNNGSCELANNRCYTTNDCDDNYICGASNNCVEDPSICNPICKEWENCNNGNCELLNNRCNDNSNCDAGKVCDNTHNCITEVIVEDPNELIRDRHFRRGFKVRSSIQPGDIIGSINPDFEAGEQIWTLGQWASFTDLNNFPKTITPSGDVYWEDIYKRVTIGDSDGVDLSLRVNAKVEYNNTYYVHGSSLGRTTWVHLLGEQTITNPYNQASGCPALSELTALNFSVKAKLLYDHRNISAGYIENNHTAQYLMFFTIQNLNQASAGFGDFLWFGIMLHEDRGRTQPMIQGDDFSQKLIYNIGYDILNDYSNNPITDNEWHTLEEDFLPHIITALQEAWNRGYLSDSHNLSDYKIGGMNLGWEITGLNNAELQIDDLSLIYRKRAAGVNECANGTDNCNINAVCIDTDSSFICRCNSGYTGDGINCTPSTPVDEIRYDFNVDGNKEGWTTQNMSETSPNGGLWIMSVPGNDPLMLSPTLSLDASSYSKIIIRMANDGNPLATSRLQVFWTRTDSTNFTEGISASVDVSNGGGWATYTLDLSSNVEWRGEITRLRIDPILSGDNHSVGIDYIVIAP